MVDFLLDNTLGAWHAGKVLGTRPTVADTAQSEEELREALALPGCPWNYLRFIKAEDGKWTPAARTFDGWPKVAKEITCLDPCMGSGHFVVAMFERLVALRIAEEKLDESMAVASVIRENLFGLEIDPRCTQIAAFNLALTAWRRVGHCTLPPMNLACSGLAPNSKKEDWVKLAADNSSLRFPMGALYNLFEKAPFLGSLIDPRRDRAVTFTSGLEKIQPLLEKALEQETKDEFEHEMAVTAQGVAKAAEILGGRFTLVATNVPYLGRAKQEAGLQSYCGIVHPSAAADLATCFVERCAKFCSDGGSCALVTPQNWLFLRTYKNLRKSLLEDVEWNAVARLGAGAFETIGGEVVNVALLIYSPKEPSANSVFMAIEASGSETPREKSQALLEGSVLGPSQAAQLQNPDSIIQFEILRAASPLRDCADVSYGSKPGQTNRVTRYFWEFSRVDSGRWMFMESSPDGIRDFSGKAEVCYSLEEIERQEIVEFGVRGASAWGKRGVVFAKMRKLPCSIYLGQFYDDNTYTIIPKRASDLVAIYAYVKSGEFNADARKLNQKINITRELAEAIPFDLAHWQKVAAGKYPHGLPKPFSGDATQWLFDGHPKGSDQPLHVAVARLVGYQWPRQTGSSFPECPTLGPDGLEKLADDDGIVCLSATRGEVPAAERLRELLVRAWGEDWNATVLEELLARVGYAGKTLDDWLRNGFFEQHCELFHHRPFIWHIWDGHKSGFSALVNYCQLTHANLEKLTYAYLGDWIRRQQAAVDVGEGGSDARLQAAKQLQARLKLILEGESPYDIFVRWKPLSRQAIGWYPDINDGVRMNIRPFVTADILRKRVKIKWEKDRGKEPVRDKTEFPWFWGWDGEPQDFSGVGKEPDGNRWNDCHYTNEFKKRAREAHKAQ